MRLNVHTGGDGERTALLVHGAMADHRTWHAVEGALIERGYRVVAPDMRGHGLSPRGEYTPELLAADLAESLPEGADLAIGHSMGALALSSAVERLRPRRAVYYDPGWQFSAVRAGDLAAMRTMVAAASPAAIAEANPRWSEADVQAEAAGFALFDPEFFAMVEACAGSDFIPERPVVPSLVQLADPSFTISPEGADRLKERGFEVRVVAGTGHCSHRDDFTAYMESLQGWI
ncbi:alpha/beta fold hydrolase [Nocardiopsis chromatogenes]|uniref:alpha/beta fold hydrolase n=1 Tax=Nocardiopsis chromatogenes TaxID=280239 RepID=UPI0003476C38|nr:alpha/beta hydrolase [Nocardiopsis chromatogenes]